MSLRLIPLTRDKANQFVRGHHRHRGPVVGHLFALGAMKGDELVGVAIVGRPVSRIRDDGETAEVTRLATDGTRNTCSFLYGACARAAFALGYKRIGTYILVDEPGTSLRAAGWRFIAQKEKGGRETARTAKVLYETATLSSSSPLAPSPQRQYP